MTVSVDPVLAALVTQADKGNFGIGVTVCCQGTVVSGMMISRGEYWSVMKEFVKSRSVDLRDHLAEVLAEFDRIESETTAAQSLIRIPSYLHLVGAVAFSNQNLWPITDIRVPWRCRLTAVDAWAIGNIPEEAARKQQWLEEAHARLSR